MASSNDHKETRSTTVRFGPAVPAKPHPNTILGIIPYLGDPYDAKPGLGGMAVYPPMAMAAANRNKASAPFQHAESPFAALW